MRYIRIFCFIFVALATSGSVLGQAQSTDRAEDHAALRVLLGKGAEALNTRNFDGLVPSLHPNFTIITVDNQKFVGVDAFKKYYLGLFDGSNALFSKIETRLAVDEATSFLNDNTGVAYGTSQDTYHFKDGDVRTMQTRWSAVTQKEGGSWKLVNVHFSANLLDNPVLDASKSYAKKIAAGSAVIGLIVGILLMALMRSKRRP